MYSNDLTTQILVALLKEHGIHRVIASPGTTNMSFVGSVQNDPWFQVYSSVDERSAAYIACGIASEIGEPVVITCTEATASRNYLPGLTEAFYRKLPVLAITGYHSLDHVGHLFSQCIDRSQHPADTVVVSVNLRVSETKQDQWYNTICINKAILALSHNGGGPAHINLQFPPMANRKFDCNILPTVRKITRIMSYNDFPPLPNGRIAICIGSHKTWSNKLTDVVDAFCASNNAAVFCDHTSGYNGEYKILYSIVSNQRFYSPSVVNADLLIHIGEVSGDTCTQEKLRGAKCTWRVNEDGEIRDFFKNLTKVFQMSEIEFFSHYIKDEVPNTYYKECLSVIDDVRNQIPELPFSNVWIAQTLSSMLPKESKIHTGIFNSLRSWNMTDIDSSVLSNCNVGGFGIDGCLSTAFGAAIANPEKTIFCMCGDLAFFYDMNVLGNRHMVNNLRIMLVNNAKGTEFRLFGHPAYPLGKAADAFIAAAGHYGNKSASLVKSYVEALGFDYISAHDKESFKLNSEKFVDISDNTRPIVFEIFTNSDDESKAIEMLFTSANDGSLKNTIKKTIGTQNLSKVKSVLRK